MCLKNIGNRIVIYNLEAWTDLHAYHKRKKQIRDILN